MTPECCGYRRRHLWIIVPFLLLLCWMGARGLNADPIWTDEYYSILDAGGGPFGPKTLPEIWNGVATRNPWHAPAFFMILSGWERLVGWHPGVLRMLPLFFGLLAVAWIYRLGHDRLSPRIGLYAAIVLASSVYFAYYLHEIRMYTLVTMLTSMAVWVYLGILTSRRPPRLWQWLVLFGVVLVLIYLHYFAALPVVAIGIFHLLFAWHDPGMTRADGRWRRVLLVFAIAAVLFLPWLQAFVAGIGRAVDADTLHELSIENAAVLELTFRLFANGNWLLLIPLGVLALYAARWRRVRRILVLALIILAMILTVNAVLQIVKPTRIRYLITLWPLFSILIAAAVDRLSRWHVPSQPVLGAWVMFGLLGGAMPDYIQNTLDISTYIFPVHEEYRVMRVTIRPTDYVLSHLPEGSPPGRYDKISEIYMYGLTEHVHFLASHEGPEIQAYRHNDARIALRDAERLWYAYMPSEYTPGVETFEAELQPEFVMCGIVSDQPNLRVSLFARTPVCCIPETRTPETQILFGGMIRLVGSEIVPSPVEETLAVNLAWMLSDDVPMHQYSVAVHLFNAAGEKVAQADYGLEPLPSSCHRTAIALDNLPPGDYEVRVGVYAWQTGVHLPGESATGQTGDMLPIGTVPVE